MAALLVLCLRFAVSVSSALEGGVCGVRYQNVPSLEKFRGNNLCSTCTAVALMRALATWSRCTAVILFQCIRCGDAITLCLVDGTGQPLGRESNLI